MFALFLQEMHHLNRIKSVISLDGSDIMWSIGLGSAPSKSSTICKTLKEYYLNSWDEGLIRYVMLGRFFESAMS